MPCATRHPLRHPPPHAQPTAHDHGPILAPSLTRRRAQSRRGRASSGRPAWAPTPRRSCRCPCGRRGGRTRRRLAAARLGSGVAAAGLGRLAQRESAPVPRTRASASSSEGGCDWGGAVAPPPGRPPSRGPTHSASGVTTGGLGQLCAGVAVSAAAATATRRARRSSLMAGTLARAHRGGSRGVRACGQSVKSGGHVGQAG